jgi:hypothetical protein
VTRRHSAVRGRLAGSLYCGLRSCAHNWRHKSWLASCTRKVSMSHLQRNMAHFPVWKLRLECDCGTGDYKPNVNWGCIEVLSQVTEPDSSCDREASMGLSRRQVHRC